MWISEICEQKTKYLNDNELEFGKLYSTDGTLVTLIQTSTRMMILQVSGKSAGHTYLLGGGYKYLLVSENIKIGGKN